MPQVTQPCRTLNQRRTLDIPALFRQASSAKEIAFEVFEAIAIPISVLAGLVLFTRFRTEIS